MALDIFKLQGSIEIDIKHAEASLKRVATTAKESQAQLNQTSETGKRSGAALSNAFDQLAGKIRSAIGSTVEQFNSGGTGAGAFAGGLKEISLSAGLMGSVIGGAAAGLTALIATMANRGADIQRTSNLFGLTTDQVQRFETAATAAGVKSDAFTDAIGKLRDRAKEAVRGNLEIAQSFQALGVSAQASTKNASPAFEALLGVLSRVPDAQQRITIAQRVLGEATDDQILGIVALTDANGALLNRVNELGTAIDRQAVAELARMDQEINTLKATAGNFATGAGLQLLKLLGDVRFITVGSTDGLSHFSSATTTAAAAQASAAGPIGATTGAIQNQTAAVMQLSAELASVRLQGINTAVDQTIKQIAFNSKNASEALATFKREKLLNDDFFAGVNKLDQVKKNLEAIDEARNPKAARTRTPRVGRADISEFDQLRKQLAEVNKDIFGFQAAGSREFRLRIELEGARDFKSQLEQILTLRRALGEPLRSPFPATAQGADREIARLNALKAVGDLVAKQDPMAAIRASAEAQAEAFAQTFTELDRLVKDALPQAVNLTTEQALAQSELFQALQKTNPALAEHFRQQAAGADAAIRATAATEAFKDLQGSLNNELQSFTVMTREQEVAIRLQSEAYKDLSSAQREQLLAQAREIDGQAAYRQQLDQSQRALEDFADTTRGLFETLFEQGPKRFFEELLSTVKRSLARIAAEIATSGFMRALGLGGGPAGGSGGFLGQLLGGGRAAMTGGGGGGGFLGQLLGGGQMAGAGAGGGGAGGGGGFLTGGFAGGNPAQAILGGGGGSGSSGFGGLGGVLRRLPGIGKLFGGGAKSIAGLPTITRPDVFNPALGGGSASGASGAAGSAGLFGGGMAAAMPALFSNPFTAIIGGALIGGALLSRLLGDKTLKSLRGLIRGEYGIEVKPNQVLENVKALGESKFGKEFKKKQIETVRLPEVKELLSEYAARSGQKGNSKLISSSALRDEFDSRNQFTIPRREMGGPVIAGQAYLVGERRPEVFVPSTSGQILPSVPQGGRGIVPTGGEDGKYLLEVLEELTFAVGRLQGIPAGQIVQQGLEERPGIAARDVRRAFDLRSEDANLIRERMERR